MGWPVAFFVRILSRSRASADNKVVVELEAINVKDGSLITKASQTEQMNPVETYLSEL